MLCKFVISDFYFTVVIVNLINLFTDYIFRSENKLFIWPYCSTTELKFQKKKNYSVFNYKSSKIRLISYYTWTADDYYVVSDKLPTPTLNNYSFHLLLLAMIVHFLQFPDKRIRSYVRLLPRSFIVFLKLFSVSVWREVFLLALLRQLLGFRFEYFLFYFFSPDITTYSKMFPKPETRIWNLCRVAPYTLTPYVDPTVQKVFYLFFLKLYTYQRKHGDEKK